MSYNSIAMLSEDHDLKQRLIACAAVEKKGGEFPGWWVDQHIWDFATAPGWGDAYAYAMAINKERPGRDEGVISDAMILAVVQPLDPSVKTP